jgi:hypothetical protein
MGSSYSYHIKKNGLSWWPLSGFGQYCTNKSVAVETLKKYRDEYPNAKFELYRGVAVKSGSQVIGVYQDTMEKIEIE